MPDIDTRAEARKLLQLCVDLNGHMQLISNLVLTVLPATHRTDLTDDDRKIIVETARQALRSTYFAVNLIAETVLPILSPVGDAADVVFDLNGQMFDRETQEPVFPSGGEKGSASGRISVPSIN